jgi:hypothetical protein
MDAQLRMRTGLRLAYIWQLHRHTRRLACTNFHPCQNHLCPIELFAQEYILKSKGKQNTFEYMRWNAARYQHASAGVTRSSPRFLCRRLASRLAALPQLFHFRAIRHIACRAALIALHCYQCPRAQTPAIVWLSGIYSPSTDSNRSAISRTRSLQQSRRIRIDTLNEHSAKAQPRRESATLRPQPDANRQSVNQERGQDKCSQRKRIADGTACKN